jgi:hypothetical protein
VVDYITKIEMGNQLSELSEQSQMQKEQSKMAKEDTYDPVSVKEAKEKKIGSSGFDLSKPTSTPCNGIRSTVTFSIIYLWVTMNRYDCPCTADTTIDDLIRWIKKADDITEDYDIRLRTTNGIHVDPATSVKDNVAGIMASGVPRLDVKLSKKTI